MISGTDQPCRREPELETDVPPETDLPPPPDWINAHGVAEWNRTGPKLIALGMFPQLAISQFEHYCSIYGRLVQLRAAGQDPPAAMYQVYRGLMADLGITKELKGDPDAPGPAPTNSFAGNRPA